MGFCEYDICGENLDELSDYEESLMFIGPCIIAIVDE